VRYNFFVFCFCILADCFAQNDLPPVSQWRERLPYNSAIDVTAGDGKIYCTKAYSLFTVNIIDNSIERLSRVSGLNETGISAIKYDAVSQKLLIAYSNSNIDIIYRNDIFNVLGIKRSAIIGDKRIYNIYPLGKSIISPPSWMGNWFIRQRHSAVRPFGMDGIIKGEKFPAVFILFW
jgi:hypothetical protein